MAEAENQPGSYERFMWLFCTEVPAETAPPRREAETFEEVLARTDTSALEEVR